MLKKTILTLSISLMFTSVANGNPVTIIELKNKLSGTCMDGERSTKRAWSKQNVQSFYCDNGPDQRFLLYSKDKYYNNALKSYSFPTYWLFYPSSHQRVSIHEDIWFQITPAYSIMEGINKTRLCLDASGYSGKKKANVQFYNCEDKPDQYWKFLPDGRIINKQQGMCLDVAGYEGKSNRNMQLWTCDGYLDQSWHYEFYQSDFDNRLNN